MEYQNPQLREHVNNVRMAVNPLWRGPGNIHDFVLNGKSYRQGWATAQTEENNVDLMLVQPH